MKNVLLLLLLFLTVFTANAQYSEDPLEFGKSVEKYLKKTKDKSASDAGKRFAELWELKSFNPQQEALIMDMGNKLLASRLEDNEQGYFFNALNNLIDNTHRPALFNEYLNVLEKIHNKSVRDLTVFLEFSDHLFRDLSLYKSETSRWALTSPAFTLKYENELPFLELKNASIQGFARNDQTGIYNTNALYYPLSFQWKGKGGTVNFKRGGLDTTQVYADLDEYSFETKRIEFTADSVTFYYKTLLNGSFKGKITDKLTSQYQVDNATYPKFESYDLTIVKKDIFKNIDYEGGLAMAGGKFIGAGDATTPAKLNIYIGDTLAVRTYSQAYIFYPNKIIALETEVAIFMGTKDSIYHPEVELKFLADERQLTIIRQGKGVKNTPFIDTYHRLSMEFEAIYWNIDSEEAQFGMIKTQNKPDAYFESANYYRDRLFTRVQGLQPYNPLVKLYQISNMKKSNVFSAQDYADMLGMQLKQVKNQLRELVEGGYIRYDEATETVTVYDKTLNYVQNNAGNLDYDIIRLKSYMKDGNNATFNMKDYILEVNGVSQIFMSDSQSVYVVPSNQQVKIFADRNMQFGGRVHAGTLDFYGEGFNFDYENFKINLQNIDSMTIKVLGSKNEFGQEQLINVQTVLQNINGDLYIDEKSNKSGVKNYSQYPLFDSKKESFVFYDYPYILKSVYDRERFYFRVIPFQMDSLDNLTSTSGLAFPGVLYSDNIFPDLKEVLTLQKDTSLGFVHETPVAGLPMYIDKGQFLGQIYLSEAGFLGVGKLDYLTSTSVSRDFTFMLDSTNINVKLFDIKKGPFQRTTYPQVHAEDVYTHWRPYSDSMMIYQKGAAIKMYEDQAVLEGNLIYTPFFLRGNGTTLFHDAKVLSSDYHFKQDDFNADTSDFEIALLSRKDVVGISGKNIETKINFKTRKGIYTSNLPGPHIKFPNNQYETSLARVNWDMDQYKLAITKAPVQVSDSTFFRSLHPKQDSLVFKANLADFSLRNSVLDIFEVPSIYVADAELFPENNFVQVNEGARITTLPNAKISVSRSNRYHDLFDATLDIQGRFAYTGSATYEYSNKSGKVERIYFDRIAVEDSIKRTVARGTISDTANFELNPRILFRGEVILQGDEKYLLYDGFAKLEQNSKNIRSEFFKYLGRVNPDSLLTEILDPRDMSNKKLYTGLHIGNSTGQIYTTFVSGKIEPNDHDIIAIEGEMLFDETEKIFKLGTKSKLYGKGYKGHYLTFDDRREEVYAEGKLNLGLDFNNSDLPNIKAAGTVLSELKTNQIFFDMVVAMNFEIPSKAWKLMYDKIQAASFDADLVINDRIPIYQAVSEWSSAKEATKVIDDIKLVGNLDLPKGMEANLLFTDMKMLWDETTRAYVTVDKIGVGAINDKKLGKKITGKIMMKPTRGGDEFNIYLESKNGDWWFFQYRKGLVDAISSDEEFNVAISEKTKVDKPFTIGTPRGKSDFLKKYPIL